MKKITQDSDVMVSATHRALKQLLVRANGGLPLEHVALHVRRRGPAEVTCCSDGRGDAIDVTIAGDGSLTATLSIATHWTTLTHENFRFARTPSDLLVLIGRHRSVPMHFWIEDGRIACDRGSPLLSPLQEAEAFAAFDIEFSALIGEAC